jgi:hypothetical protein
MGFEPTTFCMASRRSSQLSYSRVWTGNSSRGEAGDPTRRQVPSRLVSSELSRPDWPFETGRPSSDTLACRWNSSSWMPETSGSVSWARDSAKRVSD